MRLDDLLQRGIHTATVCNACRYCEGFCPVFPAMERRSAFTTADLHYLANLCHNCGECLYACQYAPPHEFGIHVPRTLGEIRQRSYEAYCWPRALGVAFRANGLATALGLAVALTAVLFASTVFFNPGALTQGRTGAEFYAVVPHGIMVALFGGVFAFVLVALAIGVRRFRSETWSDFSSSAHEKSDQVSLQASVSLRALRDALTLRHLHGGGVDCATAEETRRPWRRWFHHCTFYGFALCFASTSVAAVYHLVFGWEAPYSYTSLPVILGSLGGLGLLVGPAGLLVERTRRDPSLGVPGQEGQDDAFVMLLFMTSLTGLVLLIARHEPTMPALLLVHLGFVLALFVTLPYGKFVHGLYRTAALVMFAREEEAGRSGGSRVS
jgi:citrate/tricarballylate utilization protein